MTKFQCILVSLVSSQSFLFIFFYCRLRDLLTVFFSVSHDVLAFSGRLVSVYIRRQDFNDLQSTLVEIVECSQKALFCGDCCARNQAIILVVFSFC